MKLMPTLAVLAAALAVPAAALGATATNASQTTATNLFPDAVVAKGKGVEIKRSQLDEAFAQQKSRAAASGQAIPEDRRDFYLARILDSLISTKLLTQRANDADRKKADENADKYIADIKKRMPSEEMFNLQMKAMGLTPALLRERVVEQAVCDEVITREVREKNQVTEAEIKKFYDENPKDFEEGEQVRAAHVLIGIKDSADPNPNPGQKRDLPAADKEAKKKLAENILARARKGDDFAKLAKEFSEDPGSKDNGGEYTFGRGRMVPEFEAAAFATEPGKVADLVTTVFGYHIIKVLEKLPAKKVELAKASEDIKRHLGDQRAQQEIPQYLKKLREDAKVEILDPSLVTPPPPPVMPVPTTPPAPK